MAQINITLNQEEILGLLASHNTSEVFKELLTTSLNAILKAESAEQLKAKPYERSDERTDSRNGFRERDLKTRIGTITLNVPRHRNQPFKTMIFESYSRSEAALMACMAEMVVEGVSTRKVSRVVEALCGTSISKSAVSDLCKALDKEVEEFRSHPINGSYPFVVIDATYFRVRESNRVVPKALMVACGTNEHGTREILGFQTFPNESTETWTTFLTDLKKRGLTDVQMVTSDAHEGMIRALGKVFPNVPWQRCQFHFTRNITNKAPQKYQKGLSAELQEMFSAGTLEKAQEKRDEILRDYRDVAPKAMECLENGFGDSMTVMQLPKGLRRFYRTSNHIERINRELKRRSKVIGVFPNEKSLVRLMGCVLMEHHAQNLAARKVFSDETYQKFTTSTAPDALRVIAVEQRGLLAARS